MTKPQYLHNCSACKFVRAGQLCGYGHVDWYLCMKKDKVVSVIARHGEETAEYLAISTHVLDTCVGKKKKKMDQFMREAIELWRSHASPG